MTFFDYGKRVKNKLAFKNFWQDNIAGAQLYYCEPACLSLITKPSSSS